MAKTRPIWEADWKESRSSKSMSIKIILHQFFLLSFTLKSLKSILVFLVYAKRQTQSSNFGEERNLFCQNHVFATVFPPFSVCVCVCVYFSYCAKWTSKECNIYSKPTLLVTCMNECVCVAVQAHSPLSCKRPTTWLISIYFKIIKPQ